jgi:serine phosphatase RsbU (regulator of sigma subunit)
MLTKQGDGKIRGLRIASRIGLAMSLALAGMMAVAGLLLSENARGIAERGIEGALQGAAFMNAEAGPSHEDLQAEVEHRVQMDLEKKDLGFAKASQQMEFDLAEGVRKQMLETALAAVDQVFDHHYGKPLFEQVGTEGEVFGQGRGARYPVIFVRGMFEGQTGYVYQIDQKSNLVAPQRDREETKRGLFGLILGATIAVVLVGTGVAYVVAMTVSKPIVDMVDDVRQFARGNLAHRTRAKGGGEVALLARTIDRMAESLGEAQEAERELSLREREMQVAREVREALLPQKIPTLPGHHVDALHLACPEPEGDFHDYLQVAGDRIGLLVCQVNGKGVPGALVGATARAYLRNELERGGDLAEAFKKLNRELARDVRRGMYVTALYVVADAKEDFATVVCAGHKLPLVRYAAAEGKIRLVQPEGIALAFDRGQVFDKKLQVQRVPLEKGDRLFLANTGPVRVLNGSGEELGEKGFYQVLLRACRGKATQLLDRVKADLEAHADGEPLPADIAVLLLAREE